MPAGVNCSAWASLRDALSRMQALYLTAPQPQVGTWGAPVKHCLVVPPNASHCHGLFRSGGRPTARNRRLPQQLLSKRPLLQGAAGMKLLAPFACQIGRRTKLI